MQKINIIFHMDELIDEIGIVISGIVTIESIDLWGNKSILSNIACGCMFLQKLTASVCNHFRSKLSLPAIPRFFSLISADCLHNQITTTLQKHSHKKSQVICSPFPCTKTLFYQTAFFVHLPKQSEAACSFFYQMNQEEPADLILQYIMTANSSPIILMLTALHSPKNLVKCVTMV